MSATAQVQLVKIVTVSPNAKLLQAKAAPRPTSAPKSGSRFLGFLMSALGAFAV